MNIAFVNSTRKWGGVKTWMLDIGEAMKQRGHAVYVCGRQPKFVEQACVRAGQGKRLSFGADANPIAVFRFMRLFRAKKIQVVVVHVSKDLSTAGVAAKLLGIPVIQHIGMPNDIALRFKTRLLHAFIRPWFFCPCQFIAEGFLKALPYVQRETIKVLLTAKTISADTLIAHTPRQLVVTQQLNADKGHAILLRALAKTAHPFVLHIAGTGREEAALHALVKELAVEDKVVFHGFSTNVRSLLRQADIFLLASLYEGLPNTLLEALAAGLLPITRDVGGVREVLSPRLEPWIVPREADETHFHTAIERALSLTNEELLAEREAARDSGRLYCNMDTLVEQFERWLQDEVVRL